MVMAFVVEARTERDMMSIGEKVAELLQAGDFVGLSGRLAAGKTTLTKGIANGLAVVEPVTSPSYVLFNLYRGKITLIHGDFYRLDDQDGVGETGWDDRAFWGPAVTVIEWSDRHPGLLPGERLDIDIRVCGGQRRMLTVRPLGRGWLTRERRLRELLDEYTLHSGD
ncbi:MAG: tRNA (adenosine(37)-N6)-threonylcarbamoyltransferase complex ATPase subunit type 1 TsaE [Negativicutes bacterium]|nr:tRNA (adenosine(37)-N6)-threonylcarbamoyltransferase complex ATPase subunit type 1 TsaE [Negativicutes bacterium]